MSVVEMNLSELVCFQSNHSRLDDLRAQRSSIVPFVGAGVSKECGLYLWGELLDLIAQDYFTLDEIKSFNQKSDYLKYADSIIEAAGSTHMIMRKIREIFKRASVHLTKSTYILTSCFSDMVITTNYDDILETASKQAIKNISLKPLLPCLEGQMYEAIQLSDRCLLKLHGSIEETSSVILASHQYDTYYGKAGLSENKPLPSYLRNIFSARKVLFVGCSLEIDRTLEILHECVVSDQKISHYAIIPWYTDETKRINRSRQLTKLAIEPIYYPEGDYNAIGKLLCYLAKENDFLSVVNKLILQKIIGEEQEHLRSTLSAVLRESYYETASKHPELLDSIFALTYDEFTHYVLEKTCYGNEDDTIYDIFQSMFEAYIDLGRFYNKVQLKSIFKEIFSHLALRETPITELLKQKWSVAHIFSAGTTGQGENQIWLNQLSTDALNDCADSLLQKLQYKNGMSYADYKPTYDMGKELEASVGVRLNSRLRTRLLNSLGAFAPYYKDFKNGEQFLETAISLIQDNKMQEPNEMLFLAKCYNNLALVAAGMGNHEKALNSIKKDLSFKRKYNENSQLYARSLNVYATLLKEIEPFEAGNIYLEIAQIKQDYAAHTYDSVETYREMVASWATTIFNIGLLARDLELVEIAYDYVLWANKIRFQVVDPCNKDYCSSLNVQAELGLLLHQDEGAKQLVEIVKTKQRLPEGFSKIMGHTWYVCAYYYYNHEEYIAAFDFANKSLAELQGTDAQDVVQELKSRMLLGLALEKLKLEGKGCGYLQNVFEDIVTNIGLLYDENSPMLVTIYRYLMHYAPDATKRTLYSVKYNDLSVKYANQKDSLKAALEAYLNASGFTENI